MLRLSSGGHLIADTNSVCMLFMEYIDGYVGAKAMEASVQEIAIFQGTPASLGVASVREA